MFLRALDVQPNMRIIDLGGTPGFWSQIDTPLDITVVNLPGVCEPAVDNSHHKITLIEGDATDLQQFPDMSFDIVFSNSVIEHVGGAANEARFAKEVRRLAPAFWVQTPSIWFPLEAHTGIPLWWFLPKFVKLSLHKRWKRKLPAWNEMISGTVVIRKTAFRKYFPDATIYTERLIGIPKSYYAFRARPAGVM